MTQKLRDLIESKTQPGLYKVLGSADLERISRLASEFAFQTFYIAGAEVSSIVEFNRIASNAMQFPYPVDNWNAFLDWMSDLSWRPADGYILLYDNVEQFAENDRPSFDLTIDVMKGAVERMVETDGIPMYVLLQGNETFLPGLPVISIE